MQNKKNLLVIIIGIIVLLGLILTACLVYQSRPENVIKSRLNLSLPTSSKIINYEYHRKNENLAAKILIEAQSVNDVKEQLDKFFGGVTSSENMKDATGFENAVSWWDMSNENIEAAYMNFVDVKKWFTLMPHQVWTFISKDKEDKYYIYIFY